VLYLLLKIRSSPSQIDEFASKLMLSGLLARIGLGQSSTTGTPTTCVFCNPSAERGFKIAYEDKFFLAFEDIKPSSAVHYLIVPRKHIASVRTLKIEDVDLVKTMEKIGHIVLDKFGVPSDSRRMGFHIPPFNSISHLHLHVQSLPYKSRREAVSYMDSSSFADYSKGFSWFVEISQLTRILERGRQVGIGPS